MENVHATNGYTAGQQKAREHGRHPLWTGDTLVDRASNAAQAYRWQFSESTDLPLSGPDWYAYRGAFVEGYMDELALKAAEDHLINTYTTFTRNTVQGWSLDREDMAKLRFNDNPGRKDGYLIAGTKTSRVLSHTTDSDGEEWTIEVVPDVGIDLDPETYRVYQGTNGEWIVEND